MEGLHELGDAPQPSGGLVQDQHDAPPISGGARQHLGGEGRHDGIGVEPAEPVELEPGEVLRIQRFDAAWKALKEINSRSPAFEFLGEADSLPSEAEIAQLETAVKDEYIKRTCDFLRPDGKPIGERGTSSQIRTLRGGISAAQQDYDYLSTGGTPVLFDSGSMVRLPYGVGTITLRPVTSTPGSPAVDVNIPHVIRRRLHYFGDE